MQSIQVSLGQRSYPIFMGIPSSPDLLGSKLRTTVTKASQWIVVYDTRISDFAERIAAGLPDEVPVTRLPVPSGEESKSPEQLVALWTKLAEARVDRKAVVVAVGGGVLGDLAGFLAATWNRGIRFVQIPTTLLAMVDSSVGGKTGINLPTAKNVVGAFWQPHLVWADLTALSTLPDREYRSGLAEVVKYGVILDPHLFAMLESNTDRILARDPEAVAFIVQRSCELKAQVVAEDEFETTGLRAILNYGHTFGHALEALTGYGTLLHGEAVSIGMTMAAHLAAILGRWPTELCIRQTELLERLHLPTRVSGAAAIPCDPQRVLQAMQSDKKTEHGQLNLILPTRLGHVETVRGVDPETIAGAIAAYRD